MTITSKQIRSTLLLIGVFAFVFAFAFALIYTAKANPSFFLRQNNGITTTATTTAVFMTAGTATTTYYFDAASAGSQAADSAVFTEMFIGSSTSATLNVSFEYAMYSGNDCIATPNACEWFSDKMLTLNASTTPAINLDTANVYTTHFASTTVGGAAGSGNGRMTRLFNVATPTRYLRAVLTLPAGSTNGAVWGEFIGKRQSGN